ncbi:MAG: lamin tail domain-containing protein [Pelobium sp.]
MRKFLIFLSFFVSKVAFAQVSDNFSDGDFTQNPVWQADATTNFTVISGQLNSNSTAPNSNFYISTPNAKALNCTWEFDVNLQFMTSGSNYVDIYLVSNTSNLKSTSINGYFVRMGDTPHEVSLYRRSGASSTSVKIIDGRDGSLGSSPKNNFKFRVTRESNGKFTVERDSTGTGNSFFTEGSITDNTFTTTTSFGFLIQQSVASFHKNHFFDNILIQNIIPDIEPPVLNTAGTNNLTAIVLNFNEAVNASDASINSHYNITPGNIQPSSITVSGSVVTLNLGAQLNTGTYQVTVNTIKDLKGNTSSTPQSKSFFYKKPYVAKPNDIVINEIFADPSPQVDLPSLEFIELFNKSQEDISLKNFTYSDGTSTYTFLNDSLKSNRYLILCARADTNEFKQFGKVLGISPWPSLNNSGDQLSLKDGNGNVISAVSYSDTWYKDAIKKNGGWTLERIDPNSTCIGATAWTASIDSIGGTPGKPNSTAQSYATAQDLQIKNIAILNDSTIEVFLNFYPDTTQLSQAQFSSSQLGNPKQISFNKVNFNSFKLSYPQTFKESINYDLNISNIFNCSGFSLQQNTSFSVPIVPVINYPVVINEIFADPNPAVDLPEFEFLELKNLSDTVVSLKGMIYENDKTKITFDKGSILPNGFLIVCATKDTLAFQQYGNTLGLKSFPSLNNDKGILTLKNNKGLEFNRVNYDLSWYRDKEKQKGGWTLELIDPFSVCKPSQNYSASNDVSGGTPGRQNSIYLSNKTTDPLKFISAVLKDSLTITLTFNRGLDSLQATLTAQYSVNNGVGSPQSVFPIAPSFSSVELRYAQPLNRNKTYTVTADGLTDCGANTLTNQTQTFVFPAISAKNDVLINEILFNPRIGGVDYVEVYNNSDKILDFKNLKIASVNDKDSVINIKNISPTILLFLPKTFWVITTNPDTVKSQYFTAHPNNFIKLASLPAYNDDSGKAVILNKDNTRIDQLNYNENMHFALLKDLNGISLERSNFNQPTNAQGNFRSAAASVGYGTPGDKNSQFLEDVTTVEEISLASQTFSPDNDGFEDVLQIIYQFTQPNYAANITIYNDQGKMVKKLIRNETIATSGQWIWDGLDENNNKVKTGIYIIYAELFDLNGNVKKYKKTAVVASKFN